MRRLFSGRRGLWAIALSLLAMLVLVGCRSSEGVPLNETQKQDGNRLGQIIQTSGGDWAKVSPADRDFLLKMTSGDEHTARMLITPPPGGMSGKGPGGGPVGMPNQSGGPSGK